MYSELTLGFAFNNQDSPSGALKTIHRAKD